MQTLNSIDGPTKARKVKADKTVGPILKGEKYPLISIVGDRYWVDVGGIKLSYPKAYFFYIG